VSGSDTTAKQLPDKSIERTNEVTA